MKRDPALVRADRLRAITSMPEYYATIGSWIDEGHKEALHNLTSAKEVHEIHRAQGGYAAMNSLKEQFDKVFAMENVILERQSKKTTQIMTKEK